MKSAIDLAIERTFQKAPRPPCTCVNPHVPRAMYPSFRSLNPKHHEPSCPWSKPTEEAEETGQIGQGG